MAPPVVHVLRHRLALGLFLLRLVVPVGILFRGSGLNFVETGAAFLLVGGLWTPTAAAVIALIQVWGLVSGSGGWGAGFVATITAALALTGPGAWSVDAQLRGWRRIEIPPRENDRNARPS